MLQQILQQKFSLGTSEQFKLGHYDACKVNQHIFVLIPLGATDKEIILELDQLASHLMTNGDGQVYQFLKEDRENPVIEWKEHQYSILTQREMENMPVKRVGRKLAKLHYRGRSIPFKVEKLSRIGMWKSFWEQRLNQMEREWTNLISIQPENEFERMFLQSFPYYTGLTENAIQYLVDTELDEDPVAVDSGTICHERFSNDMWQNQAYMKNPFDWVFDHCARDIAEWTREKYFRNIKTYEPDIRIFYGEYGSVSTLSSFSWRLIYARLLFPLHYFECVEEYYMNKSEQRRHMLFDQLKKYLNQTREHEHFLRHFYDLAGASVRKLRIPTVEWL